MSESNVYAIGDGKGQFLSSFSVHSSGKKGTSIAFNFCETVAASKRSAALIYPHAEAAKALDFLRFQTVGADRFALVRCKWDGEKWEAMP